MSFKVHKTDENAATKTNVHFGCSFNANIKLEEKNLEKRKREPFNNLIFCKKKYLKIELFKQIADWILRDKARNYCSELHG